MEKETRTLKAKLKREVWDCESSLYDSFELKSFERQLDSAISSRTMSMPHLTSTTSVRHQPPPSDHKPASKKQSRLTRSLNKLIRAVFRPKDNHHSSSRDEGFYVYDTSSALSTIPETPETVPEFDVVSPDMKSLVTRARSDRFVPTSLGTFKMDDIFLNPFSDMYAFAGNSENDDTSSSNANENPSNTKKKLTEAWESESAFGTFNKPPKLMAIEEYSWWSRKFEDWLMAFAYPSWKSLKTGYDQENKNGETLSSTDEIESFVAEQKCVALLFQSVREDIISLIDYTNEKDLWKKLGTKCLGSSEIVKNKRKLLRKEFDLFGCLKNESVSKMIERFGHLKLELARHDIRYPEDELIDKLFDSLPDEMDWRYYALMLKNTIKAPEKLTLDLLIEKLESHELELKKTFKVNHSSYQQNLDLYYPKSMMPKATSPKTAFYAENVSTASKESQSSGNHSGYHSGSSSSASHSDAKFQCNIAIDLKNAQNFDEESAKQQMVFLASVLESYEGLVARKIGNTNLKKEDYDQIDPEEMELIDIRWAMASAVRRA
ncbi:hypothetical protein HanHA300_Chr07g0232561 [Helianthus annuus]|nr:hypothetical protein HanHA300_Chr07g0232561 [Helianthus annuus]KAJ0562301.1 hypothetical protein HanHA89_Chr07g0249721 [Helianthus annuus]KAJ0727677.1 hypothetical protein HanLR1_Chr07g0232501 [Helianthus annuus]KAJ0730475.1 hypothetical protein HanOQP8_Chr07g0240431 [Helianthus annuus]